MQSWGHGPWLLEKYGLRRHGMQSGRGKVRVETVNRGRLKADSPKRRRRRTLAARTHTSIRQADEMLDKQVCLRQIKVPQAVAAAAHSPPL